MDAKSVGPHSPRREDVAVVVAAVGAAAVPVEGRYFGTWIPLWSKLGMHAFSLQVNTDALTMCTFLLNPILGCSAFCRLF